MSSDYGEMAKRVREQDNHDFTAAELTEERSAHRVTQVRLVAAQRRAVDAETAGRMVTEARLAAQSLVATLQEHRYRMPPEIVPLFSLEILKLCKALDMALVFPLLALADVADELGMESKLEKHDSVRR